MKQKIQILCAVFFISVQFMLAQNISEAKEKLGTEKYNDAKKILIRLLGDATTPKNEVNYYLANAYYNSANADSAKLYYKNILQDEKDPFYYLAAGKIFLLNNNDAQAKTNFDKAQSLTKSKNAEIFYQIGDAYLHASVPNVQEAIKNLETANNLSPQNAVYKLTLGDAYLLSKDAGKALSAYENAVALNPKIALGYLKIARLNSDAHLYDVAIESYKKVIELEPDMAAAYKELGENYYYNKQYDKVREPFVKYAQLNEEDKEAKILIGELDFQNADYANAILEAKKVIALDSTNYVAWRMLAYSDFELKNYTEGYDAAMQFWNIQDKKVKPSDYLYSARLASQVNDSTRAMFFYTEALKNDSTNADLYSEYAKMLFASKKYTDAIAAYNAKLKTLEGSSLDYYYLGRSYYITADYKNADSIFAIFIEKQPASPDGYLWRAKSNVRLNEGSNDISAALPFYLKYIELAETDVEKNKKNLTDAYLFAVVYYSSVNEAKNTCEYFNKAKTLDPENEDIKMLEKDIHCK